MQAFVSFGQPGRASGRAVMSENLLHLPLHVMPESDNHLYLVDISFLSKIDDAAKVRVCRVFHHKGQHPRLYLTSSEGLPHLRRRSVAAGGVAAADDDVDDNDDNDDSAEHAHSIGLSISLTISLLSRVVEYKIPVASHIKLRQRLDSKSLYLAEVEKSGKRGSPKLLACELQEMLIGSTVLKEVLVDDVLFEVVVTRNDLKPFSFLPPSSSSSLAYPNGTDQQKERATLQKVTRRTQVIILGHHDNIEENGEETCGGGVLFSPCPLKIHDALAISTILGSSSSPLLIVAPAGSGVKTLIKRIAQATHRSFATTLNLALAQLPAILLLKKEKEEDQDEEIGLIVSQAMAGKNNGLQIIIHTHSSYSSSSSSSTALRLLGGNSKKSFLSSRNGEKGAGSNDSTFAIERIELTLPTLQSRQNIIRLVAEESGLLRTASATVETTLATIAEQLGGLSMTEVIISTKRAIARASLDEQEKQAVKQEQVKEEEEKERRRANLHEPPIVQSEAAVSSSSSSSSSSFSSTSTSSSSFSLREVEIVKGIHIVGLAHACKQLEEAIVWPAKYPHLYACLPLAETGVLLFGPPGTGKSLCARRISSLVHNKLVNLSLTDAVRGEVGTGEKAIVAAFAEAKLLSPSIVFIDEFQAIFAAGSNSLSATLAGCFDDIAVWNRHASAGLVIVIAATNEPWLIDRSFLRPGRFDRVVFVGPLEEEARKEMLLASFPPPIISEERIASIVSKTKRFSGADMGMLVRKLQMRLDREKEQEEEKGVGQVEQEEEEQWWQEGYLGVVATCSEKELKAFKQWERDR